MGSVSYDPVQLTVDKPMPQLQHFNGERVDEKQMNMTIQFGTANHQDDVNEY